MAAHPAIRRLGVALALLAALAACSAPDPAGHDSHVVIGQSEAAGPLPVGANQSGEPCRAELGVITDLSLNAKRMYEIRCGAWTRPSGRIFEILQPSGADELQALADAGAWRGYLDERLICDRGVPATVLNAVPAVWMKCQRRNGGLPEVALATSTGGATYLMNGLPPSQPALVATAGRLSGVAVPPAAAAGRAQSAAELLETQLGDHAFGSGDEERYYGLMKLGRLYNEEKKFAAAENAYRDALALHQRLLGADNPASAQPMAHLALALSNQQRFLEADQLFDRAEMLQKDNKDTTIRGLLLYYRSADEANQQHRAHAVELAQASQAEFAKLSPAVAAQVAASARKDQLVDLAAANGESGGDVASVNIGVGRTQGLYIQTELARLDNNLPDARKLLDETLPYAQSGKGSAPIVYANVLRSSGLTFAASKDDAQAETALRAALTELDQQAGATYPEARAHFTLGAFYRDRKRTDDALRQFRAGAAILRARSTGINVELVMPYLDALYEAAQHDAAAQPALYGEMLEATQIAQTTRTSAFISDAAARLAQGSDAAATAIRNLQNATIELDSLQHQGDVAPAANSTPAADGAIGQLDAAIDAARKRRAEYEEATQVAAPNYNQLRLATATAAGLAKLLRPGEALFALALGATHSYGLILKSDAIAAYPVALTAKQAQAAVDDLRKATVIHADLVVPPYDVVAAHALYETLFGPADATLRGVTHLVAAPTGPFLSLPFAMLVAAPSPAVTDEQYGKVDWLIRRMSISYVTSLQSFATLRQSAGVAAPEPFIGFGDFEPPTAEQRLRVFPAASCARDLKALKHLGRLASTREEVISVARLMGAGPRAVLLGRDFTKVAIKGGDLSRYRVVHFATHALLASDLACHPQPSILVSLGADGATEPKDIFLEADEILNLKLNADLVVLSACNSSSQGGRSAGESLSGLAQAFFYAGARGLVVSHWLADDPATMFIMTRLYGATRDAATGAAAGGAAGSAGGTAEAMRQAQLAMIDSAARGEVSSSYSHPFYWSLFTVIGDGLRGGPGTV